MDEGDGFCKIEYVSSKSGKRILQPMSLDFPTNSVTAIMGPSGSGKTTLLSTITDSIPSNMDARADVLLPGASAFVPQLDHLHGFYTPRTYLKHYARLAGIAHQPDINNKIEALLKKLGLTDAGDTIVGDIFFKGLSGGQQRRLSLALEALTEPINFYLDEPTSGLDSESALQVMEFLRNYAREGKGRRVILTIHQPSSFIWEKIDHAILLSKGKLMYNGSREKMETFFADQGCPTPDGWNRADSYIMNVNDEFHEKTLTVDEWAKRFEAWSLKHDIDDDGNPIIHKRAGRRSSSIKGLHANMIHTSRSNSPMVVVELTRRYFINLFFNPGILGTRIAMYSMLALMVGALFWDLGERNDFESIQSRIALAFYCVAFFIFMSVAVMPFTVMERDIVDKEVRNQYYKPIYYQLSQFICSIPGCAILAFVVTLFITTMTKMNDPLWYYLIMFESLLVSEALAQMMSHIVPHFIIGVAMLAGLFGFFMLYQGFMIIPSDFPKWLSWLYYCAFHTYAWRSFMVTEFRKEPVFTGGAFATGEEVLIFYEIEDVDRSNDMIVLMGYCLVVQIVACVVLYLRYHLFDGSVLPTTQEYKDELAKSSASAKSAAEKFMKEREGSKSGEGKTSDSTGEKVQLEI